MHTLRSIAFLSFATALVAVPLAASAQTYTAYDLGPGEALALDGNIAVGVAPNSNGLGAAEWTGSSASSLVEFGIPRGSYATGVSGSTVVGYSHGSTPYATVWNSPTPGNSGADLNPAGAGAAFGIAGNLIVGESAGEATVWTSQSPASAININPAGSSGSLALGTDGSSVVGFVRKSDTPDTSAIAWTGLSAADAVDISPSGYIDSSANSVAGTNIAGFGSKDGNLFQALWWSGANAADYSVLDSSGFSQSRAVSIAGNYIVGYGGHSGQLDDHALLWTGPNFSTRIDLNQFVSGFTGMRATGVDAAGDICGFGFNPGGQEEALLWKINPAPEPKMLILSALGVLGVIKRRFKNITTSPA